MYRQLDLPTRPLSFSHKKHPGRLSDMSIPPRNLHPKIYAFYRRPTMGSISVTVDVGTASGQANTRTRNRRSVKPGSVTCVCCSCWAVGTTGWPSASLPEYCAKRSSTFLISIEVNSMSIMIMSGSSSSTSSSLPLETSCSYSACVYVYMSSNARC